MSMVAGDIEAPPDRPSPIARVRRWHVPTPGGGLRRPPEPLTPAARGIIAACLAFSLLAIWLLCYGLVVSRMQEQRSQAELYATFREQLSQATAPLGGAIRPGAPVALLEIPRAGLYDVAVVEGTAAGQLQAGPGHRPDTPLPGQAGVSVLFGRSVTFGGPFGHVPRLRPGDAISVRTGQGVFGYRVLDVRRSGQPLPDRLPAGGSRLTLVTSEAEGWRSGWAPGDTVYVDAALAGGQVQPAPPGRPASTPAVAQAMRADSSAWVLLALWLQAAIAVAAALVWGALRWGVWQTWLAGVPIALAVLWGASETAFLLLPNLL